MNECIDPAVFSVGGADAQAVVMRVCPSVCARTEREAEKKRVHHMRDQNKLGRWAIRKRFMASDTTHRFAYLCLDVAEISCSRHFSDCG